MQMTMSAVCKPAAKCQCNVVQQSIPHKLTATIESPLRRPAMKAGPPGRTVSTSSSIRTRPNVVLFCSIFVVRLSLFRPTCHCPIFWRECWCMSMSCPFSTARIVGHSSATEFPSLGICFTDKLICSAIGSICGRWFETTAISGFACLSSSGSLLAGRTGSGCGTCAGDGCGTCAADAGLVLEMAILSGALPGMIAVAEGRLATELAMPSRALQTITAACRGRQLPIAKSTPQNHQRRGPVP